jgi:hypothetical protein
MELGDPKTVLHEAEKRKVHQAQIYCRCTDLQCDKEIILICPYVGQVLGLAQEIALGLLRFGAGLLVTNKGRSAFPRANHRQGQMQTPQSVRVLTLRNVKCDIKYNLLFKKSFEKLDYF